MRSTQVYQDVLLLTSTLQEIQILAAKKLVSFSTKNVRSDNTLIELNNSHLIDWAEKIMCIKNN